MLASGVSEAVAVCFLVRNEAVSCFRACGRPYGLRDSLCTLQLLRSAPLLRLLTTATLGMSGWLDLAQQGLSPCKKHQALLGAPETRTQ